MISFIYLLGCNKCPQQYIGETERMLKERFTEHNISKATVALLEKVFSEEPLFRKQREKLKMGTEEILRIATLFKCVSYL